MRKTKEQRTIHNVFLEKTLRKRMLQCMLAFTMVTAQAVVGIQPWNAGISEIKVSAAVKESADIINRVETITDTFFSTSYNTWSYSARVSPVSQFKTNENKYAAAYAGEQKVQIYIYNTDMTSDRIITMDRRYPLVGGVTCDRNGYYYIVYGIENETDDDSKVVLVVSKYDANGKFLNEVTYTGQETRPYSGDGWGTKNPFRSGNCSIDFNGSILACNYSRTMYNGHQSNHVIYVNTESMEKMKLAPSYISHSFDQRMLVTSDGSFLTVNHGDAYNRSFVLSKIPVGVTDPFQVKKFDTFHFREGANRDHGYNETYAQLGGITELSQSYLMAATSEKTLSLETAPTSRSYCGHSEARNLFVQYIKKDYDNYQGAARYQVPGEIRFTTGTKPSEALTELWLKEDATDYSVVWLTDYDDSHFACNAKVMTTDQDEAVLFWEKREYGKNDEGILVDSYYMILSNEGKVLKEPVSLGKVELTTDEDFVYLNGSVYWTVTKKMPQSEENKENEMRLVTYCVNLKNTIAPVSVEKLTYKYNKKVANSLEETPVLVYDQNTLLQEDVDYSVGYAEDKSAGSQYARKIIVTGTGRYSGSKTLSYTLVPEDIEIEYLDSDNKNTISVYLDHRYDSDGFQYQYSTSKDMKNAKKKNSKYGYVDLKGLQSKTTYYVRARGYVVVDGKKVYGEYTKISKVKVK